MKLSEKVPGSIPSIAKQNSYKFESTSGRVTTLTWSYTPAADLRVRQRTSHVTKGQLGRKCPLHPAHLRDSQLSPTFCHCFTGADPCGFPLLYM